MEKNQPGSAGAIGDASLIHVLGKIPLEKERTAHASILAWRIPWTEESGGLQSIESQRDTT